MSNDHELEWVLRAARCRGDAFVSKLFAEPSMIGLKQFAARAGMTIDEVEERCRRGELLALEDRDGSVKFPEWQLGPDGRPFSAIRDLMAILDGAWTVYRFLMQHHQELDGETGLEAIKAGHSVEALDVARGIEAGNFS